MIAAPARIQAGPHRGVPQGVTVTRPARVTATVEENVLIQLENLRTHPVVAARLARGELSLHGWVYKIETGAVFAYDPRQGQFLALTESVPAYATAAPARLPTGVSI